MKKSQEQKNGSSHSDQRIKPGTRDLSDPSFCSIYNTRKNKGESIRVFPLSNWTEMDIWQYIYQEGIPVVSLYFSKMRPVVRRNGAIPACG